HTSYSLASAAPSSLASGVASVASLRADFTPANMALSSASCAARAFASMVTIMGSSRCSPFLLGSWSGPNCDGSIFPGLGGAAALLGSFFFLVLLRRRTGSSSVPEQTCAAWLFLCGELVVALAAASPHSSSRGAVRVSQSPKARPQAARRVKVRSFPFETPDDHIA
ncbi:unnamed protein product, partial [Pelagomonas calceolata]